MLPLTTEDIIIPNDCFGLRLDASLVKLYPGYSRSQLSASLKAGFITLNGREAKPKDKVYGGEHVKFQQHLVSVTNPDIHLAEDIPLDIRYEDEELLVINKPAGLVVHPGAGNRQHTLINALLHHNSNLAILPRAGIVHRLDKDTTGLLLVAKTHIAHTALVKQLQERSIKRQYTTLVYGHLISGGTVHTGYGRDPHNRLKMSVRPQGKEAITTYALKRQYRFITWLDITLHTGRTHQIRVHMAHLNHPIVGDSLYGGRSHSPAGVGDTLKQALRTFPRQALHACQLTFSHPSTNQTIAIQAELPEDFNTLLHMLEANHDLSSS